MVEVKTIVSTFSSDGGSSFEEPPKPSPPSFIPLSVLFAVDFLRLKSFAMDAYSAENSLREDGVLG